MDRIDAFQFEAFVERTDAITIVHRADLRTDTYREHKIARFETEGRECRNGPPGWYREHIADFEAGDLDVDLEKCPRCDADSLVRSQVTAHDDEFSFVETCVNGECHAAIVDVAVEDYRILQDVHRGLAEDPRRLRLELLDATRGVDDGMHKLVRSTTPEWLQRAEWIVENWLTEHADAVEIPAQAKT